MGTLISVLNGLATHLQTYLTDPASPARTRWCWVEYPANVVDYPSLEVNGFETPMETALGQAVVGGQGQHSLVTVGIKIKTRQKEYHNSMSDALLVDWIYDQVTVEMAKQRTRTALNAITIQPLAGTTITEDFASELLQRTAFYIVRVVKLI